MYKTDKERTGPTPAPWSPAACCHGYPELQRVVLAMGCILYKVRRSEAKGCCRSGPTAQFLIAMETLLRGYCQQHLSLRRFSSLQHQRAEQISCGDVIGLSVAMCSDLTWLQRERERETGVYSFTQRDESRDIFYLLLPFQVSGAHVQLYH